MKYSVFPDNVPQAKRPLTVLVFLFFCLVLLANGMEGFITLIILFSMAAFTVFHLTRYFDGFSRLIALYSISYVLIFSLKHGCALSDILLNIVPPIVFYCFGRCLIDGYRQPVRLESAIILFVILTGGSVYYYTLVDIMQTGNLLSMVRELQLFGNSGYKLCATVIGTNICMGFSGISICFLAKDKSNKFFAILVFAFSILTTVHLLNRTGLFISIITLALVLVLYYGKGNGRIRFLFFFLICVFAAYHYIGNNINGELVDAYMMREMNEDASTLSGGGRTDRWVAAIAKLPDAPFGWGNPQSDYVHNMWLDVAKNTGWIPFFFLIVLSVKEINLVRKLIRLDRGNMTCILVCIIMCMLLDAFVEPIIGGFFFSMLCFWWGMQNQYCYTRFTQK